MAEQNESMLEVDPLVSLGYKDMMAMKVRGSKLVSNGLMVRATVQYVRYSTQWQNGIEGYMSSRGLPPQIFWLFIKGSD